MKHIISILILIYAFTLSAQAQYIHRDKTSFITEEGMQLSDSELISIIGMDTFTETVVGARKQYEAGSNLLWGGLLALGAGLLCSALEVYDTDFGLLLTNVLLYGGSAATDAGIVLRIIGKARLDSGEGYANRIYSSIYLGTTSNGYGLSLTF